MHIDRIIFVDLFLQIDELENNREQLLDNLDKNAADISEAEQNLDDLDRSLDASDLEDSEKVSRLS